MNVLVTGATGFIGQHLVPVLLERGHAVTALGRSCAKAEAFPWARQVRFVAHDLHTSPERLVSHMGCPEVLVDLAWQGLPNYRALFHFEENLPAHYRFLKAMVNAGVAHVLVTGTCLEYGLQSGPLGESLPSAPMTAYALAKDTLRRFLERLATEQAFALQWVRLFYLYGRGQHPNSLLAQLDAAIRRGDTLFNMTGGEQLRDYSSVDDVARRLALLVEHPQWRGVINCCSGQPVSVRRLVEQVIAQRGADITLNLGYYPYPDYEPMAFWGCPDKLAGLVAGVIQ